MSADFTPFSALLGGALIGLAASVMLLGTGRVAGISGIVGGLLEARAGDLAWRLAFVGGLLAAGVGAVLFAPSAFASDLVRPPLVLALAGVLVGYGTRLGNGCTSGHGVCGLSRLSPRSLASVLTFMLTGALAAVATNHLLGGA
jgi:uncharacterized membrane protein YedE/YeeE